MKHDINAVVIGVSAGGFKALHTILPMFPKEFLLPVIVVQHRSASDDDYFVESLNSKCNLEVIEAEDKENIKAGKVYIAPGEYHLLVEKQRIFSLSVDELVCFSRPSIDVLFESAASAYGEQLVGVILTGANSDGSEGIKSIKKNNGLTIAQDPDTAEVNVMPLSAIATGCIDYIIPLEEIPPFINSLLEDNNGKNQH